jgi:phospholipid N-methyltransferase
MRRLSFEVTEVWPDLEGFDGILVVGRVIDSGNVAVGDAIHVDTAAGRVAAICSGVPLINFPPERRSGWIGITMTGVSWSDVLVGGSVSG